MKVLFAVLVWMASLSVQALDYPYAPYNEGKMDPQKTGWPLTDEEREYVLLPEHERRPGREINQDKPAMWPVTPSAGFWGGTSWLDTHANLVKVAQTNKGPIDVLLVGDSITIQWGAAWPNHFPSLKMSAVGYFFGHELHQKLGVPMGLITSCKGGTPAETWMPREVLSRNPELAWTADPKLSHPQYTAPGLLYNGMIHPLVPYRLRGAVWYQGEGAWIKLTWEKPQTVSRVWLVDRPNPTDQVTGGTIQFSHGTAIEIEKPLPDGRAKGLEITFEPKTMKVGFDIKIGDWDTMSAEWFDQGVLCRSTGGGTKPKTRRFRRTHLG